MIEIIKIKKYIEKYIGEIKNPTIFPSNSEQKSFMNNGYRMIIQPENARIFVLSKVFKLFKFIY